MKKIEEDKKYEEKPEENKEAYKENNEEYKENKEVYKDNKEECKESKEEYKERKEEYKEIEEKNKEIEEKSKEIEEAKINEIIEKSKEIEEKKCESKLNENSKQIFKVAIVHHAFEKSKAIDIDVSDVQAYVDKSFLVKHKDIFMFYHVKYENIYQKKSSKCKSCSNCLAYNPKTLIRCHKCKEILQDERND